MSENATNTPNEILHIRRELSGAWHAFFGQHGLLTEAQRLALPLVLAGHNVLVSAPTATGKTEAVVAPVARRNLRAGTNALNVLFITPTRALANDMLNRLEGPLGDLGIKCALKHGDKPTLSKVPPNWLITTPESLDSMLCRRPEYFQRLHTIILDEIHLLDGTYRGDQLRILLERARQLTEGNRLAIHMLSATLTNPQAAAARYAPDVAVVKVTGGRLINQHYVADLKETAALARSKQWRKLLVFCNKRESVEVTAASLAELWKTGRVVAHHGKLSRHTREESEEVMRSERFAICVSTSTLEIGIDIGNVDAVVLAEPPYSVSSLMQRVGRGNRRTKQIEAVCIATSNDEVTLLKSMFESALRGDYQPDQYVPDLSVCVQQILSYLFQNQRGVAPSELYKILAPLAPEEAIRAIIANLQLTGWVTQSRGTLFPATMLLDEADKGTIHSNIADDGDIQVLDITTNKPVGKIGRPFSRVFLLGGVSWELQRDLGTRIEARRRRQAGESAVFTPSRNVGKWFHLLPVSLRS